MVRLIAIVAAVTVMGCGGKPNPGPTLSQRQRDSVLGASRLPGASGVRGAQRLADSQAARNARLDSISRP